jgi:hypothetical protein
MSKRAMTICTSLQIACPIVPNYVHILSGNGRTDSPGSVDVGTLDSDTLERIAAVWREKLLENAALRRANIEKENSK